MKTYEVLFFDLDHTLVDTRGQYQLSVDETAKRLYGSDVPEDFTDRFLLNHARLWSLYDRREITMAELRRQRYLMTWRDFGVEHSVDDADRFQQAYDATFESTLHTFPGIIEMLTSLAENHRFGIVTNGSPDLQWRKTRIVGLNRFFTEDDLIISEHIGQAKPHPSVYAAACERLDVAPSDALMIGDNYRGDVIGARDFGLDAIWFGPDDAILSPQLVLTAEAPLRTPTELIERIRELEEGR
jgi:HAD superfamily hydrolase (TIGR01549 family)